jgi:hypothetical protein
MLKIPRRSWRVIQTQSVIRSWFAAAEKSA